MDPRHSKKTISIRITVFGVFVLVVGLTAGLSLGLQYYFSRDLARTAAQNVFLSLFDTLAERLQVQEQQSARLIGVLSYLGELEHSPDQAEEQRVIYLLSGMMEQNPHFYSVYVGYDNGDFFEMINLESDETLRASFAAAPQDRWLLIKIKGSHQGPHRKQTTYLDQHFVSRINTETRTDYDPRQRPWFIQATHSLGMIKTKPYVFSMLQAPGVTFAKSMNDGQRVVAADLSLASLSSFLAQQQLLPQSKVFLFDQTGTLIAQARQTEQVTLQPATATITLTADEQAFLAATPVIKASNEMDWPPFDFTLSGSPRGYSVDLLNLLAQKAGFRVEYINGFSWNELVSLFQQGKLDLLHSVMRNAEREGLGLFTTPYMATDQVFAVRTDSPFPASLTALAGRTVAMPRGWHTDHFLAAHYPQIKRLPVSSTLEALRAVEDGRADATLDMEPVLRFLANSYFLTQVRIGGRIPELKALGPQGLHFLVRPEKKPLVTILNKALAAVTPEEQARLRATWLGDKGKSEERVIRQGSVPHDTLLDLARAASLRPTAAAAGAPRILRLDDQPYFTSVGRLAARYGADQQYVAVLVPVAATLGPFMEKVRFSLAMTLLWLLVLTPVVWYCTTIIVKPINALVQESNKVKQRRYEEVELVASNITEIYGLSRSMVSMAASIQAYERSQRELMDAFIQLIATAIDQKSPYTGAHCARVPELAIRLAQAASASTAAPFVDFAFTSEDQWHAFRTAAWLHDCGKVATPEYIVDKATKLETIYNRIHEVRMRFEVLLRDAQLVYWQGLVQGEEAADLDRALAEKTAKIHDDFAFVAQCNVGSEHMAEEHKTRLSEIAAQTWIRHLDDRLGLGPLEQGRYDAPGPELPCVEPLLADKAEHRILRPKGTREDGLDFGFVLEEPALLSNLGELYNLRISRGTLTAEDRYTINEHIITTIRMLETLPYPEHMRCIPDYAGSHHETLIGTGYPRRLTGKDIGIPGRIMALADVFEALTASDRPYKTAKTLSEAVRILHFMVRDQHLDTDLFRLFLTSGIYLEYATAFLAPQQIDEVEVAEILATL